MAFAIFVATVNFQINLSVASEHGIKMCVYVWIMDMPDDQLQLTRTLILLFSMGTF